MATQPIDLSAGFVPKQADLSAGFQKKLAQDDESGRDILHKSTDRDSLVEQAKDAAPELEAKLKRIIKGIAGVNFDAVRDQKTPERLTEKIEKEDQPVHTIPDILAARLIVDTPEARDAAVNAIKQNFDVIREEDEFEDGNEQTGYRVHKLQVQVTPELSAEIHIVPKEVAAVNDEQHDAYERMRDAALEAKEANDGAMEKFEQRNGIDDSASKSQPQEVAEKSPEQDTAASQRAAGSITKGQRVKLPDGRGATVHYVPSKSAKLPTYRFKSDDGKTVEMRSRDVEGKVKPEEKQPGYIAVDLDGTLSKYHGFKGKTVIGPPVPKMVARVKRWLANGEDVRIFTARIDSDHDGSTKKAIEEWSKKYLGQVLPVINKKDEHMKALFDDRAVQVERNDGTILGSHKKARGE